MGGCVCVRACACVPACVRACVHACVRAFVRSRACMWVRVCVSACVRDAFAIYDNNISPMLIMIIIIIIILYFVQIRHSDDFPSTGTWLHGMSVVNALFFEGQ